MFEGIREIVDNSSYDWSTLEGVTKNLLEEGFIINEVDNLEKQRAALFYSKDDAIKIISVNKDLREKKKLVYIMDLYAFYKLNSFEEEYGFINHYCLREDGVNKKDRAYFRRQLVSESFEKTLVKTK